MNCNQCDSMEIIKRGFNYGKDYKVQKYQCMSCKNIFSYPDRIPHTHISSEIVSLCIDLYLKGLSYRVIKQQLREQFDLRVNHVTIYNWIQTYVGIIKKYVDKFNPQLSAVWQMDETWIAFKGPRIVTNRLDLRAGNWCWICIDTATRFITDMYLANHKTLAEGRKFFARIKASVNAKPEIIATDGNNAYINCMREFYPNTQHLKIRSISVKPNTSFIERFNGTVKNRTKTMRGFFSFYPCQNTLTAFQIYYNFLRPHMALNGKTPAQAAGINIELPERWTSLIRKALVLKNYY